MADCQRSLRVYRYLPLVIASLLLAPTEPFAADIFVYARQDGSRLITDHARVEPGYTLIKAYAIETDESPGTPAYQSGQAKLTASDFDVLIDAVSREVSVDPALIKSVMQAESGFDPDAVSHKGASGLMQLMPATATRYGVTQIFNPQQNVLAGSRYLEDLLGQFNGNTRLALAGYNAGENAVLKYGGIPPYSETLHYVEKVMDLYRRYGNQDCANAPSGVKVVSCTR